MLLEDGQDVPEGTVEVRPEEGFHRPRWTGTAWEEGKPASEILEEKKAAKLDEFAARAIDELSPHFTRSHGRDETLHILAAHVSQIAQSLDVAVDPRLSEVVATGQKALDKKQQVERTATEEELEAIQ